MDWYWDSVGLLYMSRDAFIIPSKWYRTHSKLDHPPEYPLSEHYLRYMLRDRNIIAIACIIPYPIILRPNLNQNAELITMTVLQALWSIKLINVLRRYPKMRKINIVLFATFRKSRKVLGIVATSMLITFIIFGTIVYYLEKGKFEVSRWWLLIILKFIFYLKYTFLYHCVIFYFYSQSRNLNSYLSLGDERVSRWCIFENKQCWL